jgi:pimeloyl-ACP methyl ester carboxylesterase
MNAMTKRQLAPYTKGFVTSADGNRIGYRQLGSGPGVVLLHGGVNSSQHLMRLGSALAGTFTVDIPDRRGRGLSGPIGADYGLRTEDEDLAALLKQTGARNVFGVADGALFALQRLWRNDRTSRSSRAPADPAALLGSGLSAFGGMLAASRCHPVDLQEVERCGGQIDLGGCGVQAASAEPVDDLLQIPDPGFHGGTTPLIGHALRGA